jgi:hypothetical protein
MSGIRNYRIALIKDDCLLGYCALYSGSNLPTFQGCFLPLTLGQEVASFSETSVNFYQTARRNTPEDSHLHNLVMFKLYSPIVKRTDARAQSVCRECTDAVSKTNILRAVHRNSHSTTPCPDGSAICRYIAHALSSHKRNCFVIRCGRKTVYVQNYKRFLARTMFVSDAWFCVMQPSPLIVLNAHWILLGLIHV